MTSSETNPNLTPPPVRPVSPYSCYGAYISALIVGILAWWVFQSQNLVNDRFYTILIVDCVATVVIWFFSIANNNSSIYDPYWVIAPPLLAFGILFSSGFASSWSFRHIIIIGCLLLWSSRYHIFYKWTGWRTGLVHEDWRYENMRKFPVPYWLNSLLGMHLIPTVLVFFAFAPGIKVLLIPAAEQAMFSIFDALGIVAAVSAVLIQYFSDRQLQQFRSTDTYKKGGVFRGGLWNYSRHPNYFGEVLFWISMMFFGIAAGLHLTAPILVFVGPAAMAVFFRFSAWLMDVRSLERRPQYKQVMEEVNGLIPWFPKTKRKGKEKTKAEEDHQIAGD